MAEEQNKDLKRLKGNYEEIKKKHSLPEFDKLNKDFRIEKICESQTDYLIREVRGAMFNFLENNLNLLEAIQNPMNAPLYIQHFSKSMTEESKEKVKNLHKEISSLNVKYISTLIYSEGREAEAIKEASKKWDELKKDFEKVITDTVEKFKKSLEDKEDEEKLNNLAG